MRRAKVYLPRIMELAGAIAVVWAVEDLFGIAVGVLVGGVFALGAAFLMEADS